MIELSTCTLNKITPWPQDLRNLASTQDAEVLLLRVQPIVVSIESRYETINSERQLTDEAIHQHGPKRQSVF